MGAGQSKKANALHQESQRNNKSAESRMNQMELSLKELNGNVRSNLQKMKNKQETTNTRIDTLETAEIALGNNLKSLKDDVDSLRSTTDALGTYIKSTVDSMRSTTDALGTYIKSTSDNVDSLAKSMATFKYQVKKKTNSRPVIEKSDESQTEERKLLSSARSSINQHGQAPVNYQNNINQFGQAPVNFNFVTRTDQDDKESDEEY